MANDNRVKSTGFENALESAGRAVVLGGELSSESAARRTRPVR